MHRAVNAIGACLQAVNAVTAAMLGITALGWETTAAADRVNMTVMILQILSLCGKTVVKTETAVLVGKSELPAESLSE